MTQIKICGLSRQTDIDAVNAVKPDYIGFVFAESRRRVTPEQATTLKSRLAPGIQAAGVFVNAPITLIAQLVTDGIIDVVQLHGDEDSCFIANLRRTINTPIIQAFRIDSEEDILAAQASPADYILLDSGLPQKASLPTHNEGDAGASPARQKGVEPFAHGENNEPSFNGTHSFGGTGKRFDWELTRGLRRPFFLAGGIGLDNIGTALSLRPFAIDVSSGAETAGLKDAEKIRRLTETVHSP